MTDSLPDSATPAAAPATPILVGVGIVSQREEDANDALEPIDLMIEATRAAGGDTGEPDILTAIDRIIVPVGRWSYQNPGGMIADAVGSPTAKSVSVHAGISQQTILSDAASAIASGSINTALVVGGEAGYRLKRAKAESVELTDRDTPNDADGEPDEVHRPDHSGILSKEESEAGLGFMAVGYYAILETAWRHARGMSLADHEQHMADRYARFSEIAVENPHGWDTQRRSAKEIMDAPVLAYPYRKHHVSNWGVDQASALLLCSVAEAKRRGIPESKWIYPHAFTEANHAVVVGNRDELHRCRGAEIAGQAALEAAGCSAADLDFVELYTCFPVAVSTFAEAIGLNPARDLSFSGAMPFGGGPFNNFVLHCTAQLAQHLRAQPESRGLISAVSGFLTKQGFAVWGTEPNPAGYQFIDVTEQVAAATTARAFTAGYSGPATVAGYTVLHDREGPTTAVVVADLPDGSRAVVANDDPAVMARLQAEEFCGQAIDVAGSRFETR